MVIGPLAGFNSQEFTGSNLYHSLQAKGEKRFSSGFTILSSYVLSRKTSGTCGLDNATSNAPGCAVKYVRDLRAGPSQHHKHRFVASYIYDFPIGRGRHFGSSWNGAVNAVLSGWRTNVNVTFASGQPFTINAIAFLGGPETACFESISAEHGDCRLRIFTDCTLIAFRRSVTRKPPSSSFAVNKPPWVRRTG